MRMKRGIGFEVILGVPSRYDIGPQSTSNGSLGYKNRSLDLIKSCFHIGEGSDRWARPVEGFDMESNFLSFM